MRPSSPLFGGPYGTSSSTTMRASYVAVCMCWLCVANSYYTFPPKHHTASTGPGQSSVYLASVVAQSLFLLVAVAPVQVFEPRNSRLLHLLVLVLDLRFSHVQLQERQDFQIYANLQNLQHLFYYLQLSKKCRSLLQ